MNVLQTIPETYRALSGALRDLQTLPSDLQKGVSPVEQLVAALGGAGFMLLFLGLVWFVNRGGETN